MALRSTSMLDRAEPILVRRCSIESSDGEIGPLVLSLSKPKAIQGGDVECSLRFECKHFDETLTLNGSDGIQVFALLLSVGKAHLDALQREGFIVWWTEKGDLDYFDFWSYQPKPSEFCLKSAYRDAALDAFLKATQNNFLMPSHRVAIEPERPGITTYAVQDDGKDVVDGLIGPDDMKGISPDELCRRLGRMILNGSEEGRQLLARRREARDYPTNARSST